MESENPPTQSNHTVQCNLLRNWLIAYTSKTNSSDLIEFNHCSSRRVGRMLLAHSQLQSSRCSSSRSAPAALPTLIFPIDSSVAVVHSSTRLRCFSTSVSINSLRHLLAHFNHHLFSTHTPADQRFSATFSALHVFFTYFQSSHGGLENLRLAHSQEAVKLTLLSFQFGARIIPDTTLTAPNELCNFVHTQAIA